MAKARDTPPILMRRTKSGLEPSSQMEAELMERLAMGSDVEVTVKTRRSHPQLRLYWVGLQNLVDATECAPTAEIMHERVKFELGYVEIMHRLDGSKVYAVKSAAFSEMDGQEFKVFFDRARKLVLETYGVDPWQERQAA